MDSLELLILLFHPAGPPCQGPALSFVRIRCPPPGPPTGCAPRTNKSARPPHAGEPGVHKQKGSPRPGTHLPWPPPPLRGSRSLHRGWYAQRSARRQYSRTGMLSTANSSPQVMAIREYMAIPPLPYVSYYKGYDGKCPDISKIFKNEARLFYALNGHRALCARRPPLR